MWRGHGMWRGVKECVYTMQAFFDSSDELVTSVKWLHMHKLASFPGQSQILSHSCGYA